MIKETTMKEIITEFIGIKLPMDEKSEDLLLQDVIRHQTELRYFVESFSLDWTAKEMNNHFSRIQIMENLTTANYYRIG